VDKLNTNNVSVATGEGETGTEVSEATADGATINVADDDEDEESTRAINFLIGVMVFLTVVYLITKLFILEKSILDFDFKTSTSEVDEIDSQYVNSDGGIESATSEL